MKNSRLSQMNYRQLNSVVVDIAILPWGATEPHGYHLPYGTDFYQAEELSVRAANLANGQGINAIVLPPIPFGSQNQGQREEPGCINLRPTTQLAILDDIAASLYGQGIQRFVIFNGHGGNDFHFAIRELQLKYPEMLIIVVEWWRHPSIPKLVENPGEHAGALDTCIMMHLFPELVSSMEDAGSGRSVGFNISALNERWAWTPRDWSEVSEDTGVGDPRSATPELGALVVDTLVADIADLLVKLVRVANIYQRIS
jgi:creatinine amidohydrolase